MITVFGSLNVDLVVRVAALPTPGETVLAPDLGVFGGGKGANQALAAARAGSVTAMAGCVGDDGFAATALAALRAAGVGLDAVVRAPGEATGCALIAVDRDGENQIVVAAGANRRARAAAVGDDLLAPRSLVVAQLEVDPAETAILFRRARARGARTLLNAAPALPAAATLLPLAEILVVNEVEARMLAGDGAATPLAAGRALRARHGGDVVLTLGASGVRALTGGGDWSVAAMPVTVVDTTGAGDAFVGALAAALDHGDDWPSALRFATAAAGLACTRAGAQDGIPGRAEIAAAVGRVDVVRM